MEIIKKEDTKGGGGTKSTQMTLAEKKLVAKVDVPRQIIDNTGTAAKINVSATINGAPAGVDNATNLEVAKPDSDIKQMLSQLQQKQGGIVGEGGVGGGVVGPDGVIVESKFPPLSVNIVRGMLYTVYMIPSYVYRVDYHPDEFTINVKAQQLTDLMARYGITDVKYIDVIFFGAGVVGDLSGAFGVCKELREEKNKEKKHKEEVEAREEQRLFSGSGVIDTPDNTMLSKAKTESSGGIEAGVR